MKKVKLLDGSIFACEDVRQSTTEYAEGKARPVLLLELPDSYTVEQLKAAFGKEANTEALVIGEEDETGNTVWNEMGYRHYNLLLSCGYQFMPAGTDPQTGAEAYEDKLVVRLGKRAPEEIEVYRLRQCAAEMEEAITHLAYGAQSL